MNTNLEIIRSVIDRVLWTAGATEQNRALLAEAISEALAHAVAAPGTYGAVKKEDQWMHDDMHRDATQAVANMKPKDVKAAYIQAREDLSYWRQRAMATEAALVRPAMVVSDVVPKDAVLSSLALQYIDAVIQTLTQAHGFTVDQCRAVVAVMADTRTVESFSKVPSDVKAMEDMRQLFESVTLQKFAAANFERYPSGNYIVGWVQDQWLGWQAYAAYAAQGTPE